MSTDVGARNGALEAEEVAGVAARRVLVFRTGHLGDTVCAIPAFRLIRQHFTGSRMALLYDRPSRGKVPVAEVIRGLGLFDDQLSYRSNHGLMSWIELAVRVKVFRPDVLLVLPQARQTPQDLRRKRRFFRSCGVPDVRAVQRSGARSLPLPGEASRLVAVLHDIGIPGAKPGYGIPVDEAARARVGQRLAGLGLPAGKPFLAFCGGGKCATQLWDLRRYASVLAAVGRELWLPAVAVGTAAELSLARSVLLPALPDVRLMENLGISELFELLRLATAYFGNDTGPMHVAAAVSCPVAAVLSCRNPPGAWDPDVQPRFVFRHRTECEGCFLTECAEEKHRCMTSITEEHVLAGLLPFLTRVLVAREEVAANHQHLAAESAGGGPSSAGSEAAAPDRAVPHV